MSSAAPKRGATMMFVDTMNKPHTPPSHIHHGICSHLPSGGASRLATSVSAIKTVPTMNDTKTACSGLPMKERSCVLMPVCTAIVTPVSSAKITNNA